MRGRARRSVAVRTAAWAVAGAAAVVCAAWPLSGLNYHLDLLASFQSWPVAAAACLGLALAAFGLRGPATLAAAGVLLGAWPLVVARPVSVPPVDLSGPPAPGLVRVVSMNIGPQSGRWQQDLAEAMSWHAGVVVVHEVPPELNRGVRRFGLLDGTGWAWVHRSWVDGFASPSFVFARGPTERLDFPEVEHGERDVLVARVELPAGPLLVAAAHPHSPRSPGRWRLGNGIHARVAAAAAGRASETGLPLVMAADLNAGPAAWRSRVNRAAGLRMSKPLTGGWGTYPAGASGPLRVQIDDVWVGPGVDVAAWSKRRVPGSDHFAVIVDLRLPGVLPGGGRGDAARSP